MFGFELSISFCIPNTHKAVSYLSNCISRLVMLTTLALKSRRPRISRNTARPGKLMRSKQLLRASRQRGVQLRRRYHFRSLRKMGGLAAQRRPLGRTPHTHHLRPAEVIFRTVPSRNERQQAETTIPSTTDRKSTRLNSSHWE